MYNGLKIFDVYKCNTIHGIEKPEFDETLKNMFVGLMKFDIYYKTYGDEITQIAAVSEIFREMFKNLETLKKDPKNAKKFIWYSGHDSNIRPILAILL